MQNDSEFVTFCEIPVENVLAKAAEGLVAAVARISTHSLATSNEDDLAAELARGFELDVPHLDFDAMTVAQGIRMVPGEHFPRTYAVTPGESYEKKTAIFRIPYAGNAVFLRCYDSTRSLSPARVSCDGSSVSFEVLSLAFDADEIARERDGALKHLRRFLPPVADAVTAFNEQLPARALALIRARKKEIEADSGVLASLGNPVAHASAPPSTLAVAAPVRRRPIRISTATGAPGRLPDPTLDDATYDDILAALSDYGRQMERSPSTYQAMGEEDIRNHLLALLQATFTSTSATGESFNRSGKTDILLRHQNHNLFVAECKVWSGASAYLAALSQLLGYLTWRDSKAALIMFVRNKDISKVLSAIDTQTATHANFVDVVGSSAGVYRFDFSLPGDAGIRVRVAVLAFHIP